MSVSSTSIPFQIMRRIKSYVSRHRRFSSEQEAAFHKLLSRYALPSLTEGSEELGTSQKKFDFNQIFLGKDRQDVVLELGFGEGRFLLNLAKQFPDKHFIGMEVYKKGVAKILGQIEELKLSNLNIFWGDAVSALNQAWPSQVLSEIYVLFPDPWPKTRHHKRRIIQADFLEKLVTLLKLGGKLHLTTDDVDYRDHMLALASKNSRLESVIVKESDRLGQGASMAPRTKYEARAERHGLRAWDLVFRRLAP